MTLLPTEKLRGRRAGGAVMRRVSFKIFWLFNATVFSRYLVQIVMCSFRAERQSQQVSKCVCKGFVLFNLVCFRILLSRCSEEETFLFNSIVVQNYCYRECTYSKTENTCIIQHGPCISKVEWRFQGVVLFNSGLFGISMSWRKVPWEMRLS